MRILREGVTKYVAFIGMVLFVGIMSNNANSAMNLPPGADIKWIVQLGRTVGLRMMQ